MDDLASGRDGGADAPVGSDEDAEEATADRLEADTESVKFVLNHVQTMAREVTRDPATGCTSRRHEESCRDEQDGG